jgi:hypothetical protein
VETLGDLSDRLGEEPMKYTISILRAAWKETLTTDYQNGILYIERDLQASFYHHVRRLSRDRLTLFNEVPGFLKQGKPDLVVCCGNAVEAVIEFKFDVCKLKFEGDLTKLARWANAAWKSRVETPLALNPKTLKLDYERQFVVSDKTMWIFAAVTQSGEDAVKSVAVKQCLQSMRKDVPWSRFWHFTGVVSVGSDGQLRSAERHL